MMADEQALQCPRDFETLRAMIVERATACRSGWRKSRSMRSTIPTRSPSARRPASPQAAMVQPSTLVRFAQAFGYQGFSELQEVFRSRLRERVLSYDERLAADAPARHRRRRKSSLVLDGFLEAAQRSVAELSRQDRPRGARARRRHPGGRRDDLPDRAEALVPDHLLYELRHGQARHPQHPGRCGRRAWAPSRRASSPRATRCWR